MTRREMVKKTLWRSTGAALACNATGRGAPSDPTPGTSEPRRGQTSAQQGLTHYVAEFVVNTAYIDVPANVIEIGRKSILDGLGLAIAGSVSKSGEISRTYLNLLGLSCPEATVIGSSIKTPPRFAAFANGIGIHADDYDDTQLSAAPSRVYGLLTHPTVAPLSAALAVAEARGMSGRDMMLAYHLGVEVECKTAEAINPRHYEDGFHSTGTCGTFGATAAAAKLRGLEQESVANAFGIAGAQAAGLRANFGTMTKPFQAGHAAESGVVAAELAALGWTAAENILEAKSGFFHAAGGGYDLDFIFHKLGNPWTFAWPGVSIKPFPCGSLTHPGMTAMLRLIHEHHITADQVQQVTVGTNHNMPSALIYHDPQNGLQAKFSMEFSIAALLLYGKAGLNQFTDEVVNRPEVQSMIKRVRLVVDPRAEAAGYDKMKTFITIRLKNGLTISGSADVAKGNPADPMTFEDLAAKFQDCAEFGHWPGNKAKAVIEMVRELENVPDVRVLTALCAK